jgi:osmotically-inducible protein OsmY
MPAATEEILMMNARLMTMTAVGALAASMTMVGCSKPDQDAVKSSAEQAVAQVDQKARELGTEAKDAARDASQGAKDGAQKLGEKVDDAVITASVKTEIAKDAELSALKINVDTSDGNVALRGTAPSMAAKEHATTLAVGVKGVANVDNQLSIEPRK